MSLSRNTIYRVYLETTAEAGYVRMRSLNPSGFALSCTDVRLAARGIEWLLPEFLDKFFARIREGREQFFFIYYPRWDDLLKLGGGMLCFKLKVPPPPRPRSAYAGVGMRAVHLPVPPLTFEWSKRFNGCPMLIAQEREQQDPWIDSQKGWDRRKSTQRL